jgi:gliding motility-associated-like protein
LPTTSNNSITGVWTPAINNTATTTYTFTPTAGQCATTTTMTVTVDQPIIPAFTQVSAICSGGTFTLPTTSNNSITGVWAPAINNTATTTYTFTPTAGQCANTTTMMVMVVSQPGIPIVSTPVTFCQFSNSQSLTATGNYPLNWYTTLLGGVGSSNAPIPITTTTGTFNYYVSQINESCEGPRTLITVEIKPKPVLGSDKELKICVGSTANLTNQYNTSGLTTQWYFNSIPVLNPSSVNQGGMYQLEVMNSFGCKDTAKVMLGNYPVVSVNAGPDGNTIQMTPYQLNGSGGIFYQWSPSGVLNNANISNPIAMINNDTRFELFVRDENGCVGYDTVWIRVFSGGDIYLPNAFTPNDDGLNDLFRPQLIGNIRIDNFIIYNRYGEKIFETTETNKGWDGKYKGVRQQTGSYVYLLSIIRGNNQKAFYKGNILLIR